MDNEKLFIKVKEYAKEIGFELKWNKPYYMVLSARNANIDLNFESIKLLIDKMYINQNKEKEFKNFYNQLQKYAKENNLEFIWTNYRGFKISLSHNSKDKMYELLEERNNKLQYLNKKEKVYQEALKYAKDLNLKIPWDNALNAETSLRLRQDGLNEFNLNNVKKVLLKKKDNEILENHFTLIRNRLDNLSQYLKVPKLFENNTYLKIESTKNNLIYGQEYDYFRNKLYQEKKIQELKLIRELKSYQKLNSILLLKEINDYSKSLGFKHYRSLNSFPKGLKNLNEYKTIVNDQFEIYKIYENDNQILKELKNFALEKHYDLKWKHLKFANMELDKLKLDHTIKNYKNIVLKQIKNNKIALNNNKLYEEMFKYSKELNIKFPWSNLRNFNASYSRYGKNTDKISYFKNQLNKLYKMQQITDEQILDFNLAKIYSYKIGIKFPWKNLRSAKQGFYLYKKIYPKFINYKEELDIRKKYQEENKTKYKLNFEKIKNIKENLNINNESEKIDFDLEYIEKFNNVPGVISLSGISFYTNRKEILNVGQSKNLKVEILKFIHRSGMDGRFINKNLNEMSIRIIEDPRWFIIGKDYHSFEINILLKDEYDFKNRELFELQYAIKYEAKYFNTSITQRNYINMIG